MARARGDGSVTAAASWAATSAVISAVIWAAGRLRRAMGLAVAMALFAMVGESRAHLWHEAAEDMEPSTIEAVVSALERAAEELEEGELKAQEGAEDSSELLAFELMRVTGSLQELPYEAERVLTTYDALRYGVVDTTGEFASDANLMIWLEAVRPADAPSLAPFKARLDAWRAKVLEDLQ